MDKAIQITVWGGPAHGHRFVVRNPPQTIKLRWQASRVEGTGEVDFSIELVAKDGDEWLYRDHLNVKWKFGCHLAARNQEEMDWAIQRAKRNYLPPRDAYPLPEGWAWRMIPNGDAEMNALAIKQTFDIVPRLATPEEIEAAKNTSAYA